MRSSLGLTIVLYALGLLAWCLISAVRGRRSSLLLTALGFLEVALIGQAVLDLVAVTSGHPDSVATNLAYALTSLAVLPIAAASVRLDPGRWGSAALGLGCLLVLVVSVRLHQTAGNVHA